MMEKSLSAQHHGTRDEDSMKQATYVKISSVKLKQKQRQHSIVVQENSGYITSGNR